MAEREDASWENGKVSGSMYCGSHEHYEFLNEAFGYYGHMNALQRDVCPSSTRFEGEVIAMGLDIMHAGAITDTTPGGLVTSGGSGSILHAMLSYREAGARRGIDRPNVVKPETGSPGLRQGLPPSRNRAAEDRDRSRDDPRRRRRRARRDRRQHGRHHRLRRQLRLRHDRPDQRSSVRSRSRRVSACTSTGASAGSSFRSASSSATTSRRSTSGFPASRPSRPTPTSTATASRERRCCCSATASCATASTSSRPVGAAASTARPASTGRVRAACWPRVGRRWCRSVARATSSTRRRSSRPRSRCRPT